MFQNIITNTNFFFEGKNILFHHLYRSADYEESIRMQVIKISINNDKYMFPAYPR